MPDRFFRAELPQAAACESAPDRERQRPPFAVGERRDPDHQADRRPGVWAGDETREERPLEREVRGVVVQQQARHHPRGERDP